MGQSTLIPRETSFMAEPKDPYFAGRLKELREAAGLTQEQLAKRAGIHTLTVAKLEQGIRQPTWATVQALADALDVDCVAFQQKRSRPKKASEEKPEQPPQKGKKPKSK